jgi:hypothetical protein
MALLLRTAGWGGWARSNTMTKTVSQGESRYGRPEPQIELRLPKGTSYRAVKAALHKLAADVELATSATERWCVNTKDHNESGRVCLELAGTTPAQAARGMALLKNLVG